MTATPRSAFQALSGEASAPLRITAFLIGVLATLFAMIHLYAGIYGAPPAMLFRMVHLCLALALVFLAFPLRRGWADPWNAWTILDAVFLAASLWLIWYYVTTIDGWALRQVIMSDADLFAAFATLFLVAEAVRRTLGPIILIVAGFFVCHALFADHFPGLFYGPPARPLTLLRALVVGDGGIFGAPIAVMAQYVVLFILFGQLLAVVGVGDFFLRLAFSLFGHRTGGPAKASVISSGLMGMLSGSAIGNVLTTGAFTIPLMRRLGYRPAFAAGTEAAASTGGMIMPPVMGAIAFIMAEFLGMEYVEIVIAAIIPAALYFLVIFLAVHFEAKRTGLGALPRDRLPVFRTVMRREGYLLFPMALIVGGLTAGFSIVLVAVIALAGTFVMGFARRATWPTPIRLMEAMEGAARATASLSATAAAAGVIIGAIFATGLSYQVTQGAISVAGDHLWLLLLMSGLMAIVLGMGMTSSAVYITMVATVIPILRAAGVPDIAAHMFALYFGVVSNITPPIALAAFAAAPIAGANPLAASVEAAKLGVAAFVIPVMFVYQPALLMIGDPLTIIWSTATAAIGLSALAAAFVGYLFAPLSTPARMAMTAGAFLMIAPERATDLGGLAVVGAAVLLDHRFAARRAARRAVRRAAPVAQAPAGGASGPAPAPTGLLARLAASRLRRAAAEDGGEPGAGPAGLDALARVADAPGGVAEHPGRSLWLGWGVLALFATAVELLGRAHLQSRDPVLWLVAMAVLSALLVAMSALVLGLARRRAAPMGASAA
ncbi:TRAP transporter, 4TM/12TM fusion protein [Albimonas donghaensis]|uniref:TRAP transporter, 4TM/12TM fusion protein n=1 Tax=Albimonas donghaensis TaxID=356660 RepID=A0A1H2QGK0_9RHOB|nr:TRAP transporter fused permease subunit [Albimonas donghaensis]SDW06070.1 TRAP transporter, 4TM/12TM fusion protein [Albimonas donghaensis]